MCMSCTAACAARLYVISSPELLLVQGFLYARLQERSRILNMNDNAYMQLALQLAGKGYGYVSPNPMVGAVIVKNECIIGSGYHERYGEAHAERNALASCTESPKGATMYVTLEPCCHHGKQPPCVDAIIEAGISHVIVGSSDPNPLVAGKGIEILRSHGIQVTEHVLEEKCRSLNYVFFHFIQTKRPYVVMKYAMTLDGKIAAYTGASKWITGKEARTHVHQQRHRYRAIMTGVGTVLADNPLLTCRLESGCNPIRIICDTSLRTPLTSQIVLTAREVPTILATCCLEKEKHTAYEAAGCHILTVDEENGHINLSKLMQLLGEQGIDSILLEGGAALNWSALQSGIVQKVEAYIAPKLLGGEAAKTPIGGCGFPTPDDGIILKSHHIRRLGDDILIEGEVDCDVYRNY